MSNPLAIASFEAQSARLRMVRAELFLFACVSKLRSTECEIANGAG